MKNLKLWRYVKINHHKNHSHFNLVIFQCVLFYLLYAVIVNKIDKLIWIGVGMILLEGIVLHFFQNEVPAYYNCPKVF
jgi:hypothetical protein